MKNSVSLCLNTLIGRGHRSALLNAFTFYMYILVKSLLIIFIVKHILLLQYVGDVM